VRKSSALRKQGKIKEQFVAVRHSMLKGELLDKGYLKPIDLFFYILIRAQETGDPDIDKRLVFTNNQAKRYASISTFSQSKFRLWAFRLLEVTRWGRKTQQPSTFKATMKWRALIRMPKKLERINTLVKRHERVTDFRPSNTPKRTKAERLRKKHQLYQKIRKKLMDVPL